MSSIQKSTEELIESVKSGTKLRGDIYRLYDGSNSEELLENTEELQKMYQEMHKIPEVNAYLEAETELILQVRNIYRRLVGEVGIEPPDM